MRNKKNRLLATLSVVLIIASVVVGQEPNTAVEGVKPNDFSIEKCINRFDSTRTVKTSAGYQYWFADKDFIDGRTIKLSVVAPGSATHPPHKHDGDEFFFILEGTAELYLNGETRTAGAMTSFYCPPGSEHGIRNAGETELKYLVLKKYEKN